jgi:hypothetical protein
VEIDEKRTLLRHFLAALAYQTQKALRGAPESFGPFRAGPSVRTPHELVCHMNSVLGYATTFFRGGSYRIPSEEPVARKAQAREVAARLQCSSKDTVTRPTPWASSEVAL